MEGKQEELGTICMQDDRIVCSGIVRVAGYVSATGVFGPEYHDFADDIAVPSSTLNQQL
jgi:hypothetical protein